MGKIIYHTFLGSRLYIVLLCVTVIGIPLALLHIIQCTVTVVEETPNPSEFLEKWKSEHALLATFLSK